MMDSSPGKINMQPSLPPMAGVKRPAPSLLPAFEPFSSSPGFPRPSKRRALSPSLGDVYSKYPTPVPTSTTGIISSSPPKVHSARPRLQRTQSSVSERAPLSAVPVLTLPENGDEVRMGRSSNSSDYQLSANRLISRVHVKARYIAAASSLESSKIEIVCSGWNGVKVHCHGRTWELGKGDSFTSETESAEIMLDVQDARIRIEWPQFTRKSSPSVEESSCDEELSPSRRAGARNAHGQIIISSPMRVGQRLVSPVSPTPAGSQQSISSSVAALMPGNTAKPTVEVYEDLSSPVEERKPEVLEGSQESTQPASQALSIGESLLSELSEPEEDDPDEENDPIIHSFGPFGANLSSRLESITTAATPDQRGHPTQIILPASDPESKLKRTSSESTIEADPVPIVNHVINQLAFSRLSSTPLSVILNNLPSELRDNVSPGSAENQCLSKSELHKLLVVSKCIGEIRREGKDAAGKPLESEFYYIPDQDTDEERKAAVVDGLRKPSLRNCRKQHKVGHPRSFCK